MPKKELVEKFLFCLSAAFAVSVIIGMVCRLAFSDNLLLFIFISAVFNTFLVMGIYKKQFSIEYHEKINNLTKQLEYNSEHLMAIITNLPLVAYVVNKDYKFITGNYEALKFFEIDEGTGLKNLNGSIFEKDTLERIQNENEYIKENKQPFVTDKLIKLKSGKQNWFKVRKIPIFGKSGKIKGFVVFGRNIDIEKDAQKQRETYIATLSHDLKIPTLAQIRALELLTGETLGSLNDNQKEVLNLTLGSCRHMYDMLSTILSTYKYENKDISLNYEKIQVLMLIDECLRKFVKTLHKKNVKIRIKASEKFFTLYADKSQIKKAIENLADHCVSSAYENTEIVCAIKKTNQGKNVFISFGFESPYVSADKIANMFKMYITSAEKMDKVGCSLGLYLAKQIIDAHHGVIYVQSTETNYNMFNIELPCINECKLSALTC